MILLDTHAWVWWVSDPARLSRSAQSAISAAAAAGIVHLSTISAWEVALLHRRGRLEFTIPIAEWLARALAVPSLRVVALEASVAVEAADLPRTMPKDPADRFIVATARHLGVPLVTRDSRLRRHPLVKSIW